MGNKKKGRYQQKADAGLVPHRYDRDSRSFREGAFKNWPNTRNPVTREITGVVSDDVKANSQWGRNDRALLGERSTRYHRFIKQNGEVA